MQEQASEVSGKLSGIHVRMAELSDVSACKTIADRHRAALGFLPKAAFSEAVAREHLLVAETSTKEVVGFVRFNHRLRGTETAIYDICVASRAQRHGVGQALISAITIECRKFHRSSIVLRCPDGLAANGFYERVGFQRIGVLPGRRRMLVMWRLSIEVDSCSS